jgi:hypothetical protein
MQASNWVSVLISQLWILPELLVCIAGLVASIVYMPKCPKPATLALAGFVVLIVCVLSSIVVQFWLTVSAQQGNSVTRIGAFLSVIALARASGFALGQALLTYAIFSDRGNSGQFRTGK